MVVTLVLLLSFLVCSCYYGQLKVGLSSVFVRGRRGYYVVYEG